MANTSISLVSRLPADKGCSQGTDKLSEPHPHSVRLAVLYLRQHLAEKVTVADIAADIGTSERSLRRNFLRFIGLPPLAYLQRLRLTAVRDALLQGERAVSRVAACYGFTHFGRFANAYRESFGEAPSATCLRARQAFQDRAADRHWMRGLEPCLVINASSTGRCGRDMDIFADSLGEQFAASLSRMPFITVKLLPSTHTLVALDRRAARYKLTAYVISEADLIRVVTRLIAAEDGRHLWAETFNGTSNDILAFQSRIVVGVLGAVRTAIMTAEIAAARRKPVAELQDRDLVLKALPLALSPDRSGHALEALYQAMELYPDSGLAVALAAWCHAQLVTPWNENADRDRACALTLAERAGVLDPADPMVLTARAAVMTMAQDFGTADMLVRRALAYDPGYYWAWERRGWLRALTRHSQDAIADFQQALRLMGSESDGASSLFGIGTAHWCHREYAASMIWVDRAATRRPGAPGIQAQLAGCHIALGETARGRAMLTAMMRDRPEVTAGHLFGTFWFDKPCPSVSNVLRSAGLPP